MSSDAYYNPDDILAEETLVPVIFLSGAKGLGKELDNSSASRDLPAGAKADLPLWLATTLAKQGLVQLKEPQFYNKKVKRKLNAGASCEDLKSRCPYFYDVAGKLHELAGDQDMANFVSKSFTERYQGLLTKANSISDQETITLQNKLSTEELAVFEAGRQSIAAFDRWRKTGTSVESGSGRLRQLGAGPLLLRRRAAPAENDRPPERKAKRQ